jgi:hypothetical protein
MFRRWRPASIFDRCNLMFAFGEDCSVSPDFQCEGNCSARNNLESSPAAVGALA